MVHSVHICVTRCTNLATFSYLSHDLLCTSYAGRIGIAFNMFERVYVDLFMCAFVRKRN